MLKPRGRQGEVMLRDFWRDETGATSIEYGLIAAFLGIAIIASVRDISVEARKPFETTATTLGNSNNP